MYADSARDNPDMTGIIFAIEIDSTISTTPYTSVDKISYYNDQEREILFTTHSIFRIKKMESIENRLWRVELTLTKDTDEDLIRLTNYIRKEINGQLVPAELGNLMLKMKEYDKAEEIYRTLLTSTSDNVSIYDHAPLHNNIGLILTQKNDLDSAILHLNKGLEQRQRDLHPDNPDLAASHLNIVPEDDLD
ncbi:hypothetical protein I4U23_011215 [Adineta vaga]|nr:hypothetical protein I4U23_011215 [Adineta vaga]